MEHQLAPDWLPTDFGKYTMYTFTAVSLSYFSLFVLKLGLAADILLDEIRSPPTSAPFGPVSHDRSPGAC